jgi:hypothetical protein
MATKKKVHHHKRRKVSMGKKKRSGKRRKKAFLSEMISHQGLKKTGGSYLGGMLGGGIAATIDGLMGDKVHIGWKVLANAGVALVAGAGFDMPSISAGMGGATGYQLGAKLRTKMLSEMEEDQFADQDSLSDYPDAISENGEPLYLAGDGEFYTMGELEEMDENGELSDNYQLANGYQLADNYQLAETFQGNDMYPAYVNSSMF